MSTWSGTKAGQVQLHCHLLLEKKRYKEMLAGEEGIASNILSDRLKHLEKSALITREKDPNDGRQVIYSVTEKGASLIPVMLEIAAWGATQYENTDASANFSKDFYNDREAFYSQYDRMIFGQKNKNKDDLDV